MCTARRRHPPVFGSIFSTPPAPLLTLAPPINPSPRFIRLGV